jgi:LysM domain
MRWTDRVQPYVIKQGDYLSKLAYQMGFDVDTVWNDDTNAKLRQLRPNQNVLFAGDVLYVPDQVDKPPAAQSLTPGTTNTFVTDPPNVTVTLQFTDATLASQPYTVQELDQLTGLTSDATGKVTFAAPVTVETATLVFTASGATYALQIGNLDPIETLSGIFQRLQHLGFIDGDATFDASNLDLIRAGLRDFRATQPGSSPDPGDSPPASAPPPVSSPPVSSPPASSPPASSPPASSPPVSSPPASSPDSTVSAEEDNAGLSDDGTLDDATSAQLVAAHGS